MTNTIKRASKASIVSRKRKNEKESKQAQNWPAVKQTF